MTEKWNNSAIEVTTSALEDTDPIVRFAAVSVLADAGHEVPLASIHALAQHLEDPDPWVRQQTVTAIHKLADVAVPRYSEQGYKLRTTLLKLTEDQDPFVQSEAIGALDKWEDDTPRAIDRYRQAATDEVWLIRSKARRRLLSMPGGWATSTDVLRTYLRDEDQELRFSIMNLLRQKIISSSQPEEEIVNLLADRLHDPDSQIVAESIWNLALTKHPQAIRALAWKANHSPEWLQVIKSAIQQYTEQDPEKVLANISPDRPIPTDHSSPIDYGSKDHLLLLLGEKDEVLRVRAVLGLCQIPHSEAEKAIVAALRDESARVRYAAAFSLNPWTCRRKPSESALHALRPLLADPNTFVRRQAKISLNGSRWNDPGMRTECAEQRADWVEMLIAVNSCGYVPFKSPEDERALLPLLAIPYDRLREAVTTRVAWACVADQTHLLQNLLQDPNVRVRRAAVDKLRSHPDFVPLLISATNDEDEFVRLMAVQWLSQYGSTSSLTPLNRVAEVDVSEEVRTLAEYTLKEVKAHASLPTEEWEAKTRDKLERTLPPHCKTH